MDTGHPNDPLYHQVPQADFKDQPRQSSMSSGQRPRGEAESSETVNRLTHKDFFDQCVRAEPQALIEMEKKICEEMDQAQAMKIEELESKRNELGFSEYLEW